jgi:hypothetical protein
MMRAGELEGFTFPVEDGEARVTGFASWSGVQYVTVIVTKADGSTYASVRGAKLVQQAYDEAEYQEWWDKQPAADKWDTEGGTDA